MRPKKGGKRGGGQTVTVGIRRGSVIFSKDRKGGGKGMFSILSAR